MKDKKFIILGLIVFLIIVLFPFWYMRGKAAPKPEVVLTDKAVEPFQHLFGLPFEQSRILRPVP